MTRKKPSLAGEVVASTIAELEDVVLRRLKRAMLGTRLIARCQIAETLATAIGDDELAARARRERKRVERAIVDRVTTPNDAN